MPPKTNSGASKKTQEKVKTKVIEDKTFGLKNKKGAKQQKFIEQVVKQVANKGPANRPASMLDPNAQRQIKKEAEEKKKEELSMLFKPVLQTVAKGVDPKSVLCVYFKQGLCKKGDRCKFSHDLAQDRKAEKRNIYEDVRTETMEDWDEQKLEDVVNQKHGEDNIKKNTQNTQIVCKFFIEAVENRTYGWFWACPNGDTCMYRHALPPGFTLKSDAKKKAEMEGDEVSIELLVEKERSSLGQYTTKVTLESFLAWKSRKLKEKGAAAEKMEEKKRNDFKVGFMNGLTGRDLFTFNPDMVTNDDDNATDNDYMADYRQQRNDDGENEPNIQEMSVRELNSEFFASQAREADGSGTMATDDRFSYLDSAIRVEEARRSENRRHKEEQQRQIDLAAAAEGGNDEGDEHEENGEDEDYDQCDEEDENEMTQEEHARSIQKQLAPSTSNKPSSSQKSKAAIPSKGASAAIPTSIEIDESLFNLDDLQDIQDELEDLDI